MSRKLILLLAITIVVLYFTIILFMLSPLHGARGTYYGGSFMRGPRVSWCKELRWRSPMTPNIVALVSYPGSGNTWLRYLLQQVTGILTGSIYMDYGLKTHGFPAENITDGSVLVVKTHEIPLLEQNKFKAAVVLIRNPRDALLADFNRLHYGHIGTAPITAFQTKQKEQKSDWALYVENKLPVWESLHRLWLTRFKGPIHIVFYEDLVNETRETLHGILSFLNVTVSEDDMNCALSNKEGIYKRRKRLKNFDPFSPGMYRSIKLVKSNVDSLIGQYRKTRNLTRI